MFIYLYTGLFIILLFIFCLSAAAQGTNKRFIFTRRLYVFSERKIRYIDTRVDQSVQGGLVGPGVVRLSKDGSISTRMDQSAQGGLVYGWIGQFREDLSARV